MALSLLAFAIILKLIAVSTSEETCVKTDVCTCVFLKNGTVESIVSLWAVDGTKGPRYRNFHFLFNPAKVQTISKFFSFLTFCNHKFAYFNGLQFEQTYQGDVRLNNIGKTAWQIHHPGSTFEVHIK